MGVIAALIFQFVVRPYVVRWVERRSNHTNNAHRLNATSAGRRLKRTRRHFTSRCSRKRLPFSNFLSIFYFRRSKTIQLTIDLCLILIGCGPLRPHPIKRPSKSSEKWRLFWPDYALGIFFKSRNMKLGTTSEMMPLLNEIMLPEAASDAQRREAAPAYSETHLTHPTPPTTMASASSMPRNRRAQHFTACEWEFPTE